MVVQPASGKSPRITAWTCDFLVDGTAVNTEPIPFYTATSDSFDHIRIFRGTGQAGVILDDLSVTGPGGGGEEPTLAVSRSGSDVVISWPVAAGDFTLQATDSLSSPSWATVPHTTTGADNQATVPTTGAMRFFRVIGN
jgi:hypothetical protein